MVQLSCCCEVSIASVTTTDLGSASPHQCDLLTWREYVQDVRAASSSSEDTGVKS